VEKVKEKSGSVNGDRIWTLHCCDEGPVRWWTRNVVECHWWSRVGNWRGCKGGREGGGEEKEREGVGDCSGNCTSLLIAPNNPQIAELSTSSTAQGRMDLIQGLQFYVDKIVSDPNITGMKVLMLDEDTTKIVSMVYSQVLSDVCCHERREEEGSAMIGASEND
jgi:hypothetical protein